jgi:hypothetical protein
LPGLLRPEQLLLVIEMPSKEEMPLFIVRGLYLHGNRRTNRRHLH